jgi:hypothetical protein
LIGQNLTQQLNSKQRRSVYAVMANGGEAAKRITAAQLDYYLWKTTVQMDAAGELGDFPFHRTRTTDY